jgi:glycogen(starch) synthase
MKILLIGPRPPPHGGISVHVAGIHKQLVRDGITCEVLDTGQGALGLAFAWSLLRYGLRGWQLQLHTNGHNRKSWLLAIACGVAGLPGGGSVLTLHSGMAPGYLQSSSWSRRLAKVAGSLYECIVCVSFAIEEALIGVGVASGKIELSPGYLNIRMPAAPLNSSLDDWMSRHVPVFSTTMFFRPEYGFDLLISALTKFRHRHPAVGCVVMGSGEQRAAAERLVQQAGLEDAVLMAGDVDHETCLAVMARSDVFLRPTLEDGDSISVREALALKIPVIASGVGTRPPGTVLFRRGDTTDLIEKIESALEWPCETEGRHANA